MKILIFSDSHGELSHMRQAIEREKPDYVFHLGDHDRDAYDLEREFPSLPIVAVKGNCDGLYSDTPETRLIELGGLRIFLCHGHTYGVKGGLLRVCFAAREQRADLLFYGHTHESDYFTEADGLTVCNPGSCGYSYYPSYASLLIENGTYRISVQDCEI